MAFAKARTNLAALEDKLRRWLGLAGEIRAEFLPTLTPVVIAGDLREAGTASYVGRAFSFAHVGSGGAGTVYTLQPQVDVVIDQVFWSNTGGAQNFDIWLTAGAPARAATVLAGTWTDRKTQDAPSDQVPLLASNGFGALTGTAAGLTNRVAAGAVAANAMAIIPVNICLPAMTNLNFTGPLAGNGIIGCRGRIWP